MPARHWLAGTAILLLLGCTTAPPRQTPAVPHGEWPSAAPPKAHYARIYEHDDANRRFQTETEYYRWIIRFYEGSPMFPSGWKDTEAQLVEGVREERYPVIKAKLSYLGHLVSGEWAKDNGVRRIHSSMLLVWGELLRDAREDIDKERVIDRVTEDVLGLLSGALHADAIDRDRYRNLLTHTGAEPGRLQTRTINSVHAAPGR